MPADDAPDQPLVIHVNKETLDFLKLRLETDVRRRLLTGIGLPLGGGGLAALLLALFLWLPEKVRTIVNESQHVTATIEVSVTDFLKSDQGRLALNAAVSASMSSPEIRAIVRDAAAPEVKRYLEEQGRAHQIIHDFFNQSDEGRALIRAAVSEQIASPEVRRQIRDAIDQGLRSAMDSLRDGVAARAGRAIVAAETPALMRDTREIPKLGYRELEGFIAANQGRADPLTLTLTAGSGVTYAPAAVVAYSNRLSDAFGELFLGVLIRDADGSTLAFLDAAHYLRAAADGDADFHAANRDLVAAVNARNPDAARDAAERLHPGSTRALSANQSLAAALRDPLWQTRAQPTDRVAVLDADRHFLGVTWRARLVDAVVQ